MPGMLVPKIAARMPPNTAPMTPKMIDTMITAGIAANFAAREARQSVNVVIKLARLQRGNQGRRQRLARIGRFPDARERAAGRHVARGADVFLHATIDADDAQVEVRIGNRSARQARERNGPGQFRLSRVQD